MAAIFQYEARNNDFPHMLVSVQPILVILELNCQFSSMTLTKLSITNIFRIWQITYINSVMLSDLYQTA